jgi:hypothetical protein
VTKTTVPVDLDRLVNNYPLYAKLCLKISDKKGALIPLTINSAQQKVQSAIERCEAEGRPPRIIALKARQVGISTDAEARIFHRCHLRDNRTGLIVAHRSDSAKAIFKMTKRFYGNLPKQLTPAKRYHTRSEIQFKNNDSRLSVEVAGSGSGRGLTAQYVHISELAFMDDPEKTLEAVLQSVPDIADSLVIVESTAFGLNYFHDMWVRAKSGQSDFIPIFVPWHEEPGYRLPTDIETDNLTAEERELVATYGLELEQLAWRRWAIRNKCDGDVHRFRQEYPISDEEAFVFSGDPVFDPDAMKHFNQFVPPNVPRETLPPRCEIEWSVSDEKAIITPMEYGCLRIFRDVQPRHRYIAAVDPSEGAGPRFVSSRREGSDASPVLIFNQMTLDVDALWYGRKRPDLLAHTANALCRHYNEAQCVWDASPHGIAFYVEVEKLYWNLYIREAPPDSVTRGTTDRAGYAISERTRTFLMSGLIRYVNDRLGVIRAPELVAEMGTFYYVQKGTRRRAQALASGFDDALSCLAMAIEVHRGGPDNDIVPLSIEDMEVARSHILNRRIAESMGLGYDPIPDRLNITAQELEKLDERDGKRRQRERMREAV